MHFIRSALPYMPLRPCTDTEWETLPHATLTSDADWDPASLDCEGEISSFADATLPAFECKSSDGNDISSLKDSNPCDFGECLLNHEEDQTSFDGPPSFYSSQESPMASADVVGRCLAASHSSNG